MIHSVVVAPTADGSVKVYGAGKKFVHFVGKDGESLLFRT
jgi:hypothetical protein